MWQQPCTIHFTLSFRLQGNNDGHLREREGGRTLLWKMLLIPETHQVTPIAPRKEECSAMCWHPMH